jgi:hypothetical protein
VEVEFSFWGLLFGCDLKGVKSPFVVPKPLIRVS